MPNKKGNKKSDSFVLSLSLRTTPSQESVLNKRLEAARQLYNACLGEALKWQRLMEQSKAWQAAWKIENKPKRNSELKLVREQFGFRGQYSLDKVSIEICKSWIGDHLDSESRGKIAIRAYRAVERAMFAKGEPKKKKDENGQEITVWKKPKAHFRRKDKFNSVEGKTNRTGLRYKDGFVLWSGNRMKPLKLACMIDESDPVVSHGLEHEVKYCTLKRQLIGGKHRFFVDLILKGNPYEKHEVSKGIVGLDIGPSTIAYYANGANNTASLQKFCAELEKRDAEIRRLQRKMDRQLRANNPQNYNPDGTIKKGKKRWHYSKNYLKTRRRKAEIQRRQAAHRKSLHGRLVNEILLLGTTVRTEKISYKAFQKMWGKTNGFRAPGMFVEHLRRKAREAGGVLEEFATYDTKLSQICHECGECHKKELSERWHTCCGIKIQRDVYSAFLASYVEEGKLDITAVRRQWSSAESVLVRALSSKSQTVSYHGSPAKSIDNGDKAGDVVPEQLYLF